MKTWRVWQELSSDTNVWRAWRDFARGKRRRPDVADFARHADRHVLRIARDLRAHRWRHGPYRLLRVVDPKRRLVAAATVEDRVVHHAVHRVLAPLVNRRFIHHSYGCLPHKGTHRAVLAYLARAQTHPWVLHLDVRRYFYSVERIRLRSLLIAPFPEPEVRGLLDTILGSGAGLYRRADVVRWLGWEAPAPEGLGLPIGNLTSQWWGNVYLDGLDHHAQRTLKVAAYQRYMDDITVFGRSRSELLAHRRAIAAWLSTQRGLTLKDPHAQPTSTRVARHYLGMRVSREGLEVGERARVRLLQRVRAGKVNEGSLEASMAHWMFGA